MSDVLICPECQQPPQLKEGPWGPYYHCEPCDTMVGCHRGTTEPKGRMAGKATRALRIHAHDAFDPLWKFGYLSRKDAYAWLGGVLGLKKDACHIAQMSDEDLQRTADFSVAKINRCIQGEE